MRLLFLSTATGYLRHKLDPSRDPSYVYRIHNTALAIRRLGGAADMLHLSDMRIPGRARGWDVVVIHRPAMSASLAAAMETFRRHKTLVFGDFDDLIFSPAQVADRPSVRMGEKSPHVALERAQHHLEAIRELDGVIASTPVLIDAFAGLANPPARRVLLPNSWHLTWEPLRHAAPARPPALPGGAQGGETVTYFSGTRTHDADLAMIAAPLSATLAEFPGFRVSLVGKVGRDGVPFECSLTPKVPFASYGQRVAASSVNLAPLEDTRFNRAKSALKIIEAGFFGIKTVCSPIPDYVDAPASARLLASSPTQWREALRAAFQDVVNGCPERERVRQEIQERYDPLTTARRLLSDLGG